MQKTWVMSRASSWLYPRRRRNVLNPNDPKEIAEAERINERPVHRALSLDGTGTGEHGIGCGKLV
jgi:hypothetical protein